MLSWLKPDPESKGSAEASSSAAPSPPVPELTDEEKRARAQESMARAKGSIERALEKQRLKTERPDLAEELPGEGSLSLAQKNSKEI